MNRLNLKFSLISLFIFFIIWFVVLIIYPYQNEIYFEKYHLRKNPIDGTEFARILNKKSHELSTKVLVSLKSGFASFQNAYSEFKDIPLNQLDEYWNESDYFDSNTHSFQAHSMFILEDVRRASSSINDFLLAKSILFSWIENNKRFNPFQSAYSWGDHSTANRLINVLNFYNLTKNNISYSQNEVEQIKNFSSRSIAFLLNDKNYVRNNNHGIFQDLAVLYAGLSLELPKIVVLKATKRFVEQIHNGFSLLAIHKENSPAYHQHVRKLTEITLNIVQLLNTNNKYSLDKQIYSIENKLKKIIKAESYFTFGDYLPSVGDTTNRMMAEVPDIESKYVVIDQESGFGVIKIDDLKLLIRATGSWKTHKHKDEVSFILNYRGKNIVSETGFLSYKNNERILTNARKSHNSPLFYDDAGTLIEYKCYFSKHLIYEDVRIELECSSNDELLFIRNFIISAKGLKIEDEIVGKVKVSKQYLYFDPYSYCVEKNKVLCELIVDERVKYKNVEGQIAQPYRGMKDYKIVKFEDIHNSNSFEIAIYGNNISLGKSNSYINYIVGNIEHPKLLIFYNYRVYIIAALFVLYICAMILILIFPFFRLTGLLCLKLVFTIPVWYYFI